MLYFVLMFWKYSYYSFSNLHMLVFLAQALPSMNVGMSMDKLLVEYTPCSATDPEDKGPGCKKDQCAYLKPTRTLSRKVDNMIQL